MKECQQTQLTIHMKQTLINIIPRCFAIDTKIIACALHDYI